jgi:hypothetical protein
LYVNTNNTNNNTTNEDPDSSSDLEDHSYVVTNTIVVPRPPDMPSYSDFIESLELPPSTNPSPPPTLGGEYAVDFDLSDCDRLADMLDEFGDVPPPFIAGSSTGIQTRLVLRQSTTSVVEGVLTDNELPDLDDL